MATDQQEYSVRYPVLATTIFALLLLQLSACTLTPETIYEGRYTLGIEASVFESCQTLGSESPEDGNDTSREYWLVTTPESGFNEMLKAYSSHTDQYGQLQVYVRFSGTASPAMENGYGHLNMYSQQLTIGKLIEIGPWDEALCE